MKTIIRTKGGQILSSRAHGRQILCSRAMGYIMCSGTGTRQVLCHDMRGYVLCPGTHVALLSGQVWPWWLASWWLERLNSLQDFTLYVYLWKMPLLSQSPMKRKAQKIMSLFFPNFYFWTKWMNLLVKISWGEIITSTVHSTHFKAMEEKINDLKKFWKYKIWK